VGGGLRLNGAEVEGESDLHTKKGESVMTVEKVKSNGAYVLSDLVGTGAGEYLFTRTYYGYTLKQAKAQFKIALESEAK
jgi:hypothetical protein